MSAPCFGNRLLLYGMKIFSPVALFRVILGTTFGFGLRTHLFYHFRPPASPAIAVLRKTYSRSAFFDQKTLGQKFSCFV